MLKILISGANGHMGQVVAAICEKDEKIEVIAGFDVNTEMRNKYPVYLDPMEFQGSAHAVIDFSVPAALPGLLRYCLETRTPAVLCTTGYSEADETQIMEAAKTIPVFKSGNMSLGINILMELTKKATQILGQSFDIEIVERHHRRKIDAPSGTAFMLANAAREALPFEPEYIYERQSVRKPREKKEIGISAIRGGTIVGEHQVIFAGLDEVLELSHSALSRNVFASGAVAAAKFISTVTAPGLYNMKHLVSLAVGG